MNKQGKTKIKLTNVVTELLIGEHITAYLCDKEEVRFTGRVINETKNTIHLADELGSIKILPKERIMIEKYYYGKKIRIKGSLFKGLPEVRIKQEPRKLW